MFSSFDFDVIRRSLAYLFYEGMTFTLTLTVLSAFGGLVFGTLIALMRLSGFRLLAGLPASMSTSCARCRWCWSSSGSTSWCPISGSG